MTAKATFEVYEDAVGEWRWRLVHDNGNVLADGGQGFTTKRRAITGIESVMENAPGAPVEVYTVDEVGDP